MKTTWRLFLVRRALPPALLLGGLFSAPPAHAATDPGNYLYFNMTLNTQNEAAGYDLSWTAAVDPSSTTAKVTYYVVSSTGFTSPLQNNILRSTWAVVFDDTSASLGGGSGSRCFVLQASTTVSGIFAQSATRCHSYLHCGGGSNDACVTRTDGAGTQLGFGQTWKWTYNLDRDSEMIVKVFPAGTNFVTEPSGFTYPAAGATPVKIIVDNTPRSGELGAGDVVNEETWDMRDSSGAVVPNGLYFVHFTAINPLLTDTTRFAERWTIPVDTLRFTEFEATGIDASNALGHIKYTITGDATVRIVIARPGVRFAADANGDVQALDVSTMVVQTMQFNRKAGASDETWDGTDSNGVAVSSAVYAVGISARDGFGNTAVDIQGNDTSLATTIPVERQASQTAQDNTAPTISAVTVAGISIISGTQDVGSSFTSLIVTLNEDGGTGVNESIITVTGPNGAVGGVVATSGQTVTYTTGTAQTSTGTYTANVTPRDAVGNSATSSAYTFNIPAGAATPPVNQTAEQLKNSLTSFPNPAKKGTATTVQFAITSAASVDIDIFTILGERIYHETRAYTATGTNTFPWNLTNDVGTKVGSGVYLVRLTVNDGKSTNVATRKVMVIR